MASNMSRYSKRAASAPSEPKNDPAKNEAIEFEFNYYWYAKCDCHSFQRKNVLA
jgi:hypothetical protein